MTSKLHVLFAASARSLSRSVQLPLAALLAFTLLTTPSGCKKKEAAASESAATYAAGDKVDVNWKGTWWKGEVTAVKGDKYHVHYTGWSASWDEDVTADRLRAPTGTAKVGSEAPAATAAAAPSVEATAAATATPAPAAAWKVGDKVDINWKGSWNQGKVLSVTGSQYKVHYLGWGANWDETVGADRLRAPTATAKRGSSAKD